MAKIFDTISSQIIKSNPYWSYRLDTYIMPNGEPGDYHFVKSHGSVFIIPIAATIKTITPKIESIRVILLKFLFIF